MPEPVAQRIYRVGAWAEAWAGAEAGAWAWAEAVAVAGAEAWAVAVAGGVRDVVEAVTRA